MCEVCWIPTLSELIEAYGDICLTFGDTVLTLKEIRKGTWMAQSNMFDVSVNQIEATANSPEEAEETGQKPLLQWATGHESLRRNNPSIQAILQFIGDHRAP